MANQSLAWMGAGQSPMDDQASNGSAGLTAEGSSEAVVREESSSSLATEPFVGNVCNLTPLPDEGEGAPAGKGLLQFDACFEGGEIRCH